MEYNLLCLEYMRVNCFDSVAQMKNGLAEKVLQPEIWVRHQLGLFTSLLFIIFLRSINDWIHEAYQV